MVPSKWSPRGTGSCSPPDTERLSKPEVPDGGSREITSARTGADRTSDSLLSRDFRELLACEVRRIHLLGKSVNRLFQRHHDALHLRLIYALWIDVKMTLSFRPLTTFSNQ